MLSFKRGDSVNWPTIYKIDGVPVDLTNYTIASQARDRNGALACTFSITKLNQVTSPGCYVITLTKELSAVCKPGSYFQDIQYSVGSETLSTSTVPLLIERDETQ